MAVDILDAFFHSGSLPLDILERHVDWFIAKEGGKLPSRRAGEKRPSGTPASSR